MSALRVWRTMRLTMAGVGKCSGRSTWVQGAETQVQGHQAGAGVMEPPGGEKILLKNPGSRKIVSNLGYSAGTFLHSCLHLSLSHLPSLINSFRRSELRAHLFQEASAMDWIASYPPKTYVEALSCNVMVFWDRAFFWKKKGLDEIMRVGPSYWD